MSDSWKTQKVWLIKSDNRILGPLTTDTVRGMVSSRELLGHDEISQPMQRWQFVRDHPIFKSDVEGLHSQFGLDREETLTSTVAIDFSDTDNLGSVVNEEVDSINSEPATYVFTKEKKWQKAILHRATMLIVIGVGCLLLIGVALNRFYGRQHLSFDEHMTLAFKAQKLGDEKDLREHLLAADQLKENDPEVQLALATLYLSQDRKTTESRRMLTRVMTVSRDNELGIKAQTALGLASLIDGNLAEAKSHLERALRIKSDFRSARMNLGTVKYLEADLNAAAEKYLALLEENNEDTEALLMWEQTQIQLWKKKSSANLLRAASERMAHVLTQTVDYLQEARLIQAYWSFLDRDFEAVENQARELLEVDPEFTSDHAKDPLIFRDLLEWDSFLPWCLEMSQAMASNTYVRLLYGYCLIKTRQYSDAKTVLQEVIAKAPADPVVRSIQAYHLTRLDQIDDAWSVLLSINNNSHVILPMILLGRLCLKIGKADCAKENFQRALTQSSTDIVATTGLIAANLIAGDQDFSRRQLRTLMGREGGYLPLLRLMQKAGL